MPVDPITVINIAAGALHYALAVMLCVQKAALVADTVGVHRDPLAVDYAVFPLAFISSAIRECDTAQTFGLALGEFTFVNRTIGEPSDPVALDLAIDPLACVFIPVGQTV